MPDPTLIPPVPHAGRPTVRCDGCGRPLTDAESRALKRGPGCRHQIPDPHAKVEQEMLPGVWQPNS